MPRLAEARGPEGLRLYAIGDVHGRLDLLRDVHARIARDLVQRPCRAFRVIHTGDYVDRGPDSRGVIEHLIEYQRDGDAVCLAGNHDLYVLGFLEQPLEAGEEWLSQGGEATLASYGVDAFAPGLRHRSMRELRDAFDKALPESHRAFFEALPFFERQGDFLFVHAGLRPGRSLAEQVPADLVMIREPFLSDERDHGLVVVHGHTVSREPVVKGNRIGIDTRAYASGRLTCLVIDGPSKGFLEAEGWREIVVPA